MANFFVEFAFVSLNTSPRSIIIRLARATAVMTLQSFNFPPYHWMIELFEISWPRLSHAENPSVSVWPSATYSHFDNVLVDGQDH